MDYVEVWSGGPSLKKSRLQERLTGSLTNKLVYGYNNFLIVRLITDLSNQRTGFVATWGPGQSAVCNVFNIGSRSCSSFKIKEIKLLKNMLCLTGGSERRSK